MRNRLSAADAARRFGPDTGRPLLLVEKPDGTVVEIEMQDMGKQPDGRYCSVFQGVGPQGKKIRIESYCTFDPLVAMLSGHCHPRLAADETALWDNLPDYGLLPWTAHRAGGEPVFPDRREYGRLAETDTFHTISG